MPGLPACVPMIQLDPLQYFNNTLEILEDIWVFLVSGQWPYKASPQSLTHLARRPVAGFSACPILQASPWNLPQGEHVIRRDDCMFFSASQMEMLHALLPTAESNTILG